MLLVSVVILGCQKPKDYAELSGKKTQRQVLDALTALNLDGHRREPREPVTKKKHVVN